MKYLAIDIGGTFTKYAVISDACEILEKSKRPTVTEPVEEFVASLVKIYRIYEGTVDGIALSTAGIVDSEKGFIYTGGNLTSVKNLNIKEQLEKYCKVPVTVENDAKCAALAEVWQGALKDCNDGIVMVCGTGIGGAVIHDRKVLKGIHNMAGEFSYVITDAEPEFHLDHTFAGNSGIRSLKKIVSKYTGIPDENLSGEWIFSMSDGGDEKVIAGIR
ncbi:MAG: ROK family protein, partial [Clostridiales bacterium]|nr:ROK family protein [Clostridiales bacterium]